MIRQKSVATVMEGGEKSQGAGGPTGGGKGHPEGKVVTFEEEKELPIVVVDPLDEKIEKAHIAWGLKPVALVGQPDKFPYKDMKVICCVGAHRRILST